MDSTQKLALACDPDGPHTGEQRAQIRSKLIEFLSLDEATELSDIVEVLNQDTYESHRIEALGAIDALLKGGEVVVKQEPDAEMADGRQPQVPQCDRIEAIDVDADEAIDVDADEAIDMDDVTAIAMNETDEFRKVVIEKILGKVGALYTTYSQRDGQESFEASLIRIASVRDLTLIGCTYLSVEQANTAIQRFVLEKATQISKKKPSDVRKGNGIPLKRYNWSVKFLMNYGMVREDIPALQVPKASEPKASEPNASEPKASKPKASKPKAALTQPKTTAGMLDLSPQFCDELLWQLYRVQTFQQLMGTRGTDKASSVLIDAAARGASKQFASGVQKWPQPVQLNEVVPGEGETIESAVQKLNTGKARLTEEDYITDFEGLTNAQLAIHDVDDPNKELVERSNLFCGNQHYARGCVAKLGKKVATPEELAARGAKKQKTSQ